MTFEVVYLARHGQTEWNQQGRRQGGLDSPLTAAGRQHAADLAALAKSLEVDLVASSPIGRARTTAKPSADALGQSVQIVDELAEVDHGAMAGLTTPEVDVRFPGALERRRSDKYRWRFPAGESYADAEIRAAAALELIAELGTRRPLIVSHEMIGRMLLKNLIMTTPEVALSVQQPHHVVFRVDPAKRLVEELATT
ncbi:histidine phosphatase family protein [Microlunatus elymi]|uniref:histidine phosphatase family protein n=1 Tax=Microlunatus elymi TaxID=2596828 RepID=UPI00143DAE46|nr:histidine phosphatase family protein [Microlunatus elymi]